MIKSFDLTLVSIQYIEHFKELSGMSNEQFLAYMNKNNVWELLNNNSLLRGMLGCSIADIVEIIGGYLPEEEQQAIISRYYNN